MGLISNEAHCYIETIMNRMECLDPVFGSVILFF